MQYFSVFLGDDFEKSRVYALNLSNHASTLYHIYIFGTYMRYIGSLGTQNLDGTKKLRRCASWDQNFRFEKFNPWSPRLGRSFVAITSMCLTTKSSLTLRRPLRIKLRMRWFFGISKEKESRFFKTDLNDPPSDFLCASFGNYRFKPFQISFFNGFYIKIMF